MDTGSGLKYEAREVDGDWMVGYTCASTGDLFTVVHAGTGEQTARTMARECQKHADATGRSLAVQRRHEGRRFY